MKSFLFPATLLVAVPAHAAVIFTDDFSGSLSAWSAGGDVSIQSGAALLTTAHTSFESGVDAVNASGTDPLEAAGDLETFVDLTVGGLDLDVVDQATEGSALRVTIDVHPGDTLRFDWQLLTSDMVGLDSAFLVINGSLIRLASAADAVGVSSGDYAYETLTSSYSHVFTDSGAVTVAFGITDISDYSGTSALRIDNVLVQAVPEPTAGLLALLGGLAFAARRHRNVTR
ncbi:hypothetical protein HNR46_000433 [Haloferula luteola]|uniref:PEP-CTERM protein-sorting domain-containing protein n=1 Tax=Haloferula luteola TaxID=595692 RepID=A0A840V8V1_9BACT|nr:PEP-CTERM sorting domain-containing protein [Haloferula luteola]MBB5350209.1 hypothetical protein [Haloferula luteola]